MEIRHTDTTAWPPEVVEGLFDRLPDVVFFAKDAEGRYTAVNQTLVRRLGRRSKGDLVGLTTVELFPPPLGERYLAQDLAVCRGRRGITGLLELHLYPDGTEGWCITDKTPLVDPSGAVTGLAGTSRDLHAPVAGKASLAGVVAAVDTIRQRFAESLRVEDLAAEAGLSIYQLTRRVRAVFGLTPAQLIIQTRIDAARRLLAEGDASLAEIALACGYCDQSAFTRQFHACAGLTPAQYRRHARR
ncbi:MAG: AraC family transcriptional regulator [Thermoanaerobaculaceae bacterium]|nr:AraC family transcriptional regulator [Thermoanaerobaculaceae bacterium]MDI9621389.1 AraC family transcriptional regulator [Acidobacteriota bacterium]NLH10994.1 AraC family transcriptional regulator [Holophagae bacterium]HPW55430.1 AraC family transcriptional regulator [Thermoanaerobaculaceae bacterium]